MLHLVRVLALIAFAVALPAQERIRLGSWNLEFLGNRKDPPRTDADMDSIAEYIRASAFDVLAVQEVGTPEGLGGLASRLGSTWRFVLGTTGMWNDGSGGQRLGFLWNDARVRLIQAEEFLQLPREVEENGRKLPIFHRVPVSAAFQTRQGGLDFRAVTVHLKADVRRELEQKGRDELSTRKRVAEVRELGRLLGDLLRREGEDQDVVVLGDFNHVLARETSSPDTTEAKAKADLEVALLQPLDGFARVAPPRPRPTIRWFTEAIDHVVASRGLDELVGASMQVRWPWPDGDPSPMELESWQRVFSDHFPISVDLEASLDADPEASFRFDARQALAPVGGPPTAATPAAAATSTPLAPFAAGTEVVVILSPPAGTNPLPAPSYRGRLLRALHESGAWIQIEANGKHVALPVARVDRVLGQ